MIPGLDVVANIPFDPSLVKELYQDSTDLKLAWPEAKYPFSDQQWIQRFAESDESTSLIFKLNDIPIGHIALLPSHEEMYMCFVVLISPYRGQGLAEKMILETEEFCRLNYHHQELHLNVHVLNERAQKLYKKSGYEIYAAEKDNFKMKKRLKA